MLSTSGSSARAARSTRSSTPYFPMRAFVRAVVGVDDDTDANVVAARLADAVTTADPELANGSRCSAASRRRPAAHPRDEGPGRPVRPRAPCGGRRSFLGMAFTSSAVMFILEDAHHMDEASRDLVQRLARSEASRRRMLILTRQGEARSAATRDDVDRLSSLDLQPMTQAQMDELINLATEDAPLRPHQVEEIARRSGRQHPLPVRAAPCREGDRARSSRCRTRSSQ